MTGFSLKMTSAVAVAILFAAPAFAQNQDNPECLGTRCGSPQEEGGGGGGGGGSVWVQYTDDGDTLSYTDDADGDGVADDRDNCAFATNRGQEDGDGDAVGNACDNCAALSNFTQVDADGDGQGDLCDGDIDGDTLANEVDNCASIANLHQGNADDDLWGDACDDDDDNDGVKDGVDNCPLSANANQVMPTDSSVCKVDFDLDNVNDAFDNCPDLANPNQLDTDDDLTGDACDSDLDNDLVLNAVDNCAGLPNGDQLDDDRDLVGDVCDPRYCMVVDAANPDDCLDPNAPFQVHGGGVQVLKKGETLRPPLFANRNGAAIEYVWTVLKRPAGSKAAVESPKGAVTLSRDWQYAYVDGMVPSFTADVDGEYELQLQGTLVFEDRVYPEVRSSSSALKVSVGEGGGAAGCAAIPLGSPLALVGVGVLALLRRRRN